MAIPTFYRVDIRGRYAGQLVVNTYFYRLASVGLHLENTFQAASDLLRLRFFNPYQDLSVASCIYDRFILHQFDSDRINDSTLTTIIDWHSADADPGMAPAIAAVIQRQGRNPGTRRHRGKVMLGGVGRAQVVGGLMVEGERMWTAMGLLATVMENNVAEDFVDLPNMVLEPVIGNFRKRIPLGSAWDWRPIVRAQRRLNTGTQRHRAPGHGRSG